MYYNIGNNHRHNLGGSLGVLSSLINYAIFGLIEKNKRLWHPLIFHRNCATRNNQTHHITKQCLLIGTVIPYKINDSSTGLLF